MMISLTQLYNEIKVNQPSNLLNKEYVLARIKQIFPNAYLMDDWLDREGGYFHIFFYKKKNQLLNVDQLSYDAGKKHINVSLGKDDLHGRNFKNLDNAIKYLKDKKESLKIK